MTRSERVIALLTDFGTRDSYVAQMKGVIRSLCSAELIDLTHEIAPFDVFEGAFFLRDVFDSLPANTVVVAVVDPGVGSARRIVIAEERGRMLIAPDNGVLSLVISDEARVHELQTRFDLPNASRTFHGRDRFAPAAAALARGIALNDFATPVARDTLVPLDYERPVYQESRASGTIVGIDRFGNAISDLDWNRVQHLAPLRATIESHDIDVFSENYADAPAAVPFLIVGSRRTIEISMRQQSAAEVLQLKRGQRLVLESAQTNR